MQAQEHGHHISKKLQYIKHYIKNKLDQRRSHIQMNNPPKQFCEWSFEQGDLKLQQNEQEHEFELRDDLFWRKTKWMGAGISGGEPCGTHKAGGAPSTLMVHRCSPMVHSQCQKF